ncbi:hypothetical protein GCM10017783_24930 [Deinococcus piscis]|uniref:Transposase IS4-like domain-containing protein n=2 Tax=Deinococcus piscis TaxID=394230 RepID=A0ABQ3KB44_9DEIO|nr:hypothetical protein GCM10017783_24930 [Deinococcus piscis]
MRREGLWEDINAQLRAYYRVSIGRSPDAHAAIIDSQSVKATECRSERGFDGHKKVNGRKRHILVDTLGLLLKVIVHPANLVDREGGKLLIDAVKGRFPALEIVWADQGYTGKFKSWAAAQLHVDFVVVYPPWRQMRRYFPELLEQQGFDSKAFHVIPRRWVVERTFAWLGRNRRLSKDYETLRETEEMWYYLAMSRILLQRLVSP